MRVIAGLTALLALAGIGSAGQTKDTQESSPKQLVKRYEKLIQESYQVVSKYQGCKDVEKGIVYYRGEVWKHQDLLGEPRTRTNYPERKRHACAYKRWAAKQWQAKHKKYHRLITKLDDERTAICYVFGSYCRQAIAVSWCESRLHRTAQNGQYLGLFQMGDSERRIFGHGSTPLEQARAAYRYFVVSGRDWSPWSCKPW